MAIRVLIIDDEDLFREDLATLLRAHGLDCSTARDGPEGLARAAAVRPDVVLCDIVLPGPDGLEILDQLQRQLPGTGVLMITAHGSMESAVEAFRRGACDYILKPPLVDDVLQKIRRFIEHRQLQREVAVLRRDLARVHPAGGMVGRSRAMREVWSLAVRVAGTRATVLVTGESGTGKELIARAIHEAGSPEQRFVAVNCAAIPENLLESELFGHERGAFTGARHAKPGLFEVAHEGTLFLDEVADLTPALQAKMLRAIEHKEFTRVGGTVPQAADVRIVAATHQDLQERVRSGILREDLYYRLKVVEIRLPPLRERREDIPLLVEHFIAKHAREMKRRLLEVELEAMRHLMAYAWPGNVRELANVIERAMILSRGDTIGVNDLPADIRGAAGPQPAAEELRSSVRAYEAEHIRRVLLATAGNREEAARRLGIDPSTLYRKMRQHGVEPD